MSRSTNLLCAAGGTLAGLAISGAAGEYLDAARIVAELAAMGAAAGGAASGAWNGIRLAMNRHEQPVREPRHRRNYPRTVRIVPESAKTPLWPAGRPEPEELQLEDAMPTRSGVPAAARAARPAYVDPYLTPAEPDADDWPDDAIRAIDEFADLYAHPAAP